MKRVGIHELFTKMAIDVAGRSTCARVQVGAVIVKNQRVISMGWNGVPKGREHCIDHFQKKYDKEYQNHVKYSNIPLADVGLETFEEWINTPRMKEEHHEFAIRNEIHSEMNAMIFAAKNGIATDGADVYVVWSPCIDCAKALLQAGIKNVYYYQKYERDTRGIDFLQENGVNCIQTDIPQEDRYQEFRECSCCNEESS